METIGFIGLGAMGSAMASNIAKAGYAVIGCDLSPDARQRWEEKGGQTASAEELLRRCEVILTAVNSSESYERLAEGVLIPGARPGQSFIDFTTVVPEVMRRLHAAFLETGAYLLEAPMTGGEFGARDGTLRFFTAGREADHQRLLPILETMGDRERIAYCGGPGCGQLMKGVNQLAMGLIAAATIESVAYGVRGGLDPDAIAQLVGGEHGFRALIKQACEDISSGKIQHRGVKHGQLPYFKAEADAQEYALPLTAALYDFLQNRPEIIREANRMSPSFWDALTEN